MKIIIIILWLQLLACLTLTLVAYRAATGAYVHIAINSAYLNELRKEVETPDSPKQEETLWLSHLEFAELNNSFSKSEANISTYFLTSAAAGSLITFAQLILLGNHQRRYKINTNEG